MIYVYVKPFEGNKNEQHEAAYGLLFEKLREVMDVSASFENIEKTELGKPYFTDIPINFSVSHCKKYVLAAFCGADEGSVGADSETVRPYKENLAFKYFSEKEKEQAKGNDKIFTLFFSLRESYVKYTGTGLAGHMKDVSFDISGGKTRSDCDDTDFYVFDIGDAVCTVCVKKGARVDFSVI